MPGFRVVRAAHRTAPTSVSNHIPAVTDRHPFAGDRVVPVVGDSPFRGKSAGPVGTEDRADRPKKRAGTERAACLSLDQVVRTAGRARDRIPDPTVPASDSSSNCQSEDRADRTTGSVRQQAVLPATRNCGTRIRRRVTGIQPLPSAQDPCIK